VFDAADDAADDAEEDKDDEEDVERQGTRLILVARAGTRADRLQQRLVSAAAKAAKSRQPWPVSRKCLRRRMCRSSRRPMSQYGQTPVCTRSVRVMANQDPSHCVRIVSQGDDAGKAPPSEDISNASLDVQAARDRFQADEAARTAPALF